MNGFLDTLHRLGATRLIIMGSLAAMLVGGLVVLTDRVSSPDLALLYSELDVKDSSDVVNRLDAMQVPFELRGNGTRIYVPRDQVMRLRLSMAQEGLPVGGSIGYELFDRSDGFGSNSFVQNINRLRALEGELARTIRAIDRVAATRVHLVLPQREVFSKQRRQASASIIIKTRGGSRLEPAQVKAVQHLVAAAVPDLEVNRVSIIDDRGILLSRSNVEPAGAGIDGIQDARRDYEAHLKNAIETLVEQSVGSGKVRAEVTTEMNFDRITTNSEQYDPDGQVVRSTQTLEETSAATETDAEQSVSVANNLPEAQADEIAGPQSQNQRQRTEETVNYEISKKITTEVRETGTIRRLSVAVLVDGRYAQNADGASTYTPREQAELDQISTLVKSAIGFDEARGDRVEVVNLQFDRVVETLADPVDEPAFLDLSTADYLRMGEIAALIVIALLTLMFIIRPLLAALLGPRPEDRSARQIAPPDGVPELPPASGAPPVVLENPRIIAAVEAGDITPDQAALLQTSNRDLPESAESMIDIAQIEGKVKASSVRKVGELVERNPDEALSIIRSWMYQES